MVVHFDRLKPCYSCQSYDSSQPREKEQHTSSHQQPVLRSPAGTNLELVEDSEGPSPLLVTRQETLPPAPVTQSGAETSAPPVPGSIASPPCPDIPSSPPPSPSASPPVPTAPQPRRYPSRNRMPPTRLYASYNDS